MIFLGSWTESNVIVQSMRIIRIALRSKIYYLMVNSIWIYIYEDRWMLYMEYIPYRKSSWNLSNYTQSHEYLGYLSSSTIFLFIFIIIISIDWIAGNKKNSVKLEHQAVTQLYFHFSSISIEFFMWYLIFFCGLLMQVVGSMLRL